MGVTLTFDAGINPVFGAPFVDDHDLVLKFDGAGLLTEAAMVHGQTTTSTADGAAWPYFERGATTIGLGSGPVVLKGVYRSDEDSFRARNFTYADPASVGLSYLTFGYWGVADFFVPERFEGFSAGALTPGASIPTSGAAQFGGALAARGELNDLSRPLAAPITLNVDFGARSAAFSSADFRDEQGGVYAGTALTGVLTYADRTNALSGQLTSTTFAGPATARFYGPAAEEIGGAFVLTPTAPNGRGRLIGAFGAKR
jgi:hypothetical protein